MRGGIDRGDNCFRPQFVGGVNIWKNIRSGDWNLSSPGAARTKLGARGDSHRALAPRAPGNHQSVDWGGVFTRCGAVLIREITVFDPGSMELHMVSPIQFVHYGFFAITFEKNRITRYCSHPRDPHNKADKKYFKIILDTPTLISSTLVATPQNKMLKTGEKPGFWTKYGISREPEF